MNYIFLLLGNDSFYESIIMTKFVEGLPDKSGVYCITGQLQTGYFSDNPRILKIEMTTTGMVENKKLFDHVLQEGDVSGIFVFDFHKFFFKGVRSIIRFDIKWLENLRVPVNLVDYLDLYDYNILGQLYLKNSGRFNKKIYSEKKTEETPNQPSEEELLQDDALGFPGEILEEGEPPPEDITLTNPFWPNIIKVSPPYPTQIKDSSDKIFYWKSSAKNFHTGDVESMKAPLGIIEGKKNVLLIFSFQMILQSAVENKLAHYLSVIKILILYLKKLDIEMNLFIIGFDGYPELVKGTKIKLKSFKQLNHGLYKTLTCFADLIITDTPWHPILLDAADLQVPAGVIGNSLTIQEDGTFESEFEATDSDVYKELEISIDVSANIFFPFIAFPLRNKEVPEFTFYDKKFMYYLLDFYSDDAVIAFLGEFLIADEEVSEKLRETQEQYMDRAEDASETEELLRQIPNP